MTIRVLIADDHGVVAEGLRSLIEAQADMEVIALAVDGREAVRRAVDNSPDVVLMDIAMPVLNGTEATRIIRERRPRTRVIMLSAYTYTAHCRPAPQVTSRRNQWPRKWSTRFGRHTKAGTISAGN